MIILNKKFNEIENILQTKENATVLFGCGLQVNEENSDLLKLLLKMKNFLLLLHINQCLKHSFCKLYLIRQYLF